MIDMRYHVISLVAVFLALAIGILLGTTLVERGLISEQKGQIKSLQGTFDEIKKKNESLHDDLKVYQDYADEAKSYLVAGHLSGKSYALIRHPDSDAATVDSVSRTISGAGGSVPVTISIIGEKMNDQAVQNALAAMFSMPADKNALYKRVCQEIVHQLATADNPAILTQFANLGLIKMDGTLAAPVNGAVLVASDKATYDQMQVSDIPLIKSFIEASIPLLGVGGSKTSDFMLVTYKKTGISTVDNVDSSPGQAAIVLVLDGRWGNYGRGGAADSLLPPAGP